MLNERKKGSAKGKGERKKGKEEIKVKKGKNKRGEWVNREGSKERGKGINRRGKETVQKISALETKLLYNTLKQKRAETSTEDTLCYLLML